ncbi:MAG: S8 family serine peptidase, partial [Gammaproteobacteria bacterium]|nr:S8 family serine peptidase [Gammaproteobacteria bacterium]NIW46339.1 S8 family serine peptidase [Gammaproteobacteria bacterium]NIW97205.1 S8 family serine peptidase [Phycisphaerae bacterium]
MFNDSYGPDSGTSMASPAVAGVLALMLDSYFSNVSTTTRPLNSTMKAVLIQTAQDL